EERGNKILNGEEDPPGPPNNWQDNSEHNTEPSGSNFSDNQRLKFNNHLLLMTIANGWAFKWVNKKQSREAYTYLNPNLQLPDHRTLAGTTLNTVSDEIASY
ncbi:20190_t:CDS:2, partial [Gigaspora rosea]